MFCRFCRVGLRIKLGLKPNLSARFSLIIFLQAKIMTEETRAAAPIATPQAIFAITIPWLASTAV